MSADLWDNTRRSRSMEFGQYPNTTAPQIEILDLDLSQFKILDGNPTIEEFVAEKFAVYNIVEQLSERTYTDYDNLYPGAYHLVNKMRFFGDIHQYYAFQFYIHATAVCLHRRGQDGFRDKNVLEGYLGQYVGMANIIMEHSMSYDTVHESDARLALIHLYRMAYAVFQVYLQSNLDLDEGVGIPIEEIVKIGDDYSLLDIWEEMIELEDWLFPIIEEKIRKEDCGE